MVFALIQTGSVSLTKWTTYLPCRGLYAQSKQRRVRRWLGNSRINIHRLYKPLIQAALATWESRKCLYLCLDTSLFWEEYCLIRLAVVYRGRSIPLAWRVLEHTSASVSFDAYQELIRQSAQYLPSEAKVILLADRGFVHIRAMRLMKTLGWHYRIRIKKRYLALATGFRLVSANIVSPRTGPSPLFSSHQTPSSRKVWAAPCDYGTQQYQW